MRLWGAITAFSKFQFHEGPIKTLKTITMLLILPTFQFHEGPIKTPVPHDKN